MKRELEIQCKPVFVRFEDQSWAIEIKISSQDLTKVLLEFQLLANKLIDGFFMASDNTFVVNFITSTKSKKTICKKKKNIYELHLSTNDLEYITNFLFLYYRDKKGLVNHIDLFVESSEIGQDGTLMIQIESYKEPMSAATAKNILKVK